MKQIITGRALGAALEAEGLLPPNCSLVEVRIPANGVTTIVYTSMVDKADMPKLARAMLSAAGGQKPAEEEPQA